MIGEISSLLKTFGASLSKPAAPPQS